MGVKKYVKELLSLERYSFSLNELKVNINKTNTALARELSHLVVKKEIVSLRKEYYLIIPPRYAKLMRLPIELYIHNLFSFLKKDYYVGLYSAARFHGASHHQIQKDYVITEIPPLLDINKNDTEIRFFTVKTWPLKSIATRKSDAGYYNISTPALTIVDLIHHQSKLGGINRMVSTIEELSEDLDFSDLKELLEWYPYKSTLQRLGYLLELLEITPKETINYLYNHIKLLGIYPVLLSPQRDKRPGAVKNKWKVVSNINIERDL